MKRMGRKNLKLLLQSEGVEEKCCLCGLNPEWMKKPLTLPIDHIDGDSSNNDIKNLRFLCPNCHSQTISFAGRNSMIERKKMKCGCCSNEFVVRITQMNRKFCSRSCAARFNRLNGKVGCQKIIWNDSELLEWSKKMSNCEIARQLKCTETAVRKRLKILKLTPEPSLCPL